MDYRARPKRKIHPKDKSNVISKILFLYTVGIYKKGHTKDLEKVDLYEAPEEFRSKKLGDKLEKEWEKLNNTQGKPSVIHLLIQCFGLQYFLLGVMQLFKDIAETIIPPYAIGKLVSYFTLGQSELSLQDAYFYAIVLVGFNLLERIWRNNFFILLAGIGIKMRSAFSSFLYRKTLKLSLSHFGNISIGNLITLVTKDVNTFDVFLEYGNDLWVGPLKAIVISYILFKRIGVSAFAGFCSFLIIIPLQIFIGTKITALKMTMCKATDNRLHIAHETFSAIRIIKMYTWEKFFNNRIITARKKEVYITYKIFFLKFVVHILGNLNSHLAFYSLMMAYIWLGNDLSAEMVYFTKASFESVSYGMAFFLPLGIFQAAEVKSAVNRIGNIAKAVELQIKETYSNINSSPSINLNNVTVTLNNRRVLKEINLTVKNKGLVAITGPVGCGKSILLKTIIQDFEPDQGNLMVQGRISYASQDPWLFPSTIRQNILFSQKYDEKRYHQVIKVCALLYELELLEYGDNTIVEDCGGNLSKGQQARINLARAVYKDSDIYILDDPLASLDVHVRSYIFEECIKKFLKNRLIIMVTNDLKHFEHANTTLTIKKGNLQLMRSYSQIKRTYISSQNNEEESKAESYTQDDDINEGTNLISKNSFSQQVYQEDKKSGKVDKNVYKKYVKQCGGFVILFLVFTVFILAQFTMSYMDKLVSRWVDFEENFFNISSFNSLNTSFDKGHEHNNMLKQRSSMLILYNLLMVTFVVTTLGKTMVLLFVTRNASIRLHRDMIWNLINASTQFFDMNFIGNILNRLSKDLTVVDETIPFEVNYNFEVILSLAGAITLIATVNTTFIVEAIILFVVLYLAKMCCIQTVRSLKRLDALTRSPVVGYINATVEGLTTIRAYRSESILRNEFDLHQDLYNSANFTLRSNLRAFSLLLDVLCILFTGAVILNLLVCDNKNTAGDVGLTISQTFHLANTLHWAIREWTEIENQMTSVERVLEYTDVKQENQQGVELEDWPRLGEVKYENVYLSYTHSETYILKNINFTVCSKEKIGIVGRTGAGKSSVISTLFRLYEIDGKITIDDVDIKTLSLNFLRSNISIIPQNPMLFSGNIRDNFDPLGKYSDEEIWKSIEAVHLTKSILSLDLTITAGGSNFSMGQKQLICIARAILQKNKIVVLDEATANMDFETDEMVHHTIVENFNSCTVFVVTHKLHTVLTYCDKVIVLNKGEIVEYDDPVYLMHQKDSAFYKMVATAEPQILEKKK